MQLSLKIALWCSYYNYLNLKDEKTESQGGYNILCWVAQWWNGGEFWGGSRIYVFNHHALLPLFYIFCLINRYLWSALSSKHHGKQLWGYGEDSAKQISTQRESRTCPTLHCIGVLCACARTCARGLGGGLSALQKIWFFIGQRKIAQMLSGLMTHFTRRAK